MYEDDKETKRKAKIFKKKGGKPLGGKLFNRSLEGQLFERSLVG